ADGGGRPSRGWEAVLGCLLLLAAELARGAATLGAPGIVLGCSTRSVEHFAVLTPDFDVYVEECDAANTDVRTWGKEWPAGVAPLGAVCPAGIRRYDFAVAPTVAQLAQAGGGLAGLAALVGGPPPDEPAPAPAAAAAPPGGPPGEGAGDLRTLPTAHDRQGQRRREYRDSVQLLRPTASPDGPVPGPTADRWVATYQVEKGGSPLGHHLAWKAGLGVGVPPDDPIVSVHFEYSKIVQVAQPHDQIDGSNLARLELAARQLQLCEERCKDKLVGSRSPGPGGGEQFLFAGMQSTRGVMVAPALSEWIAKQLAAQSAIAKERRKAREQRQLLHPPAGARGAGQSGGGAKESGSGILMAPVPAAAAARRREALRGSLMMGLTYLEQRPVGKATLADYQRRASAFIQWCRELHLDWSEWQLLDSIVVMYFDFLYFQGHSGEDASRLLAALKVFLPPIGRWGDQAIAMTLSFACYLRPSEADLLATMQIAPPVGAAAGGSGLAALLLHPGELGRLGKTGSLGTCTKEAARSLGLNEFPVPAHGLRHGGAADGLLSKKRRALEVHQRGGWASDRNFKRRAKQARTITELQRLGPRIIAYGQAMDAALAHIFLKGRAVPVPSLTPREQRLRGPPDGEGVLPTGSGHGRTGSWSASIVLGMRIVSEILDTDSWFLKALANHGMELRRDHAKGAE
ncbi:unnamed protein product, partial [Prorocentrum cordatum]